VRTGVVKSTCLKTAIYKGCPINFDDNPYNVKWSLDHLQGLLWVTEGQFSWNGSHEKNNLLKTGAFFHSHCPESGVINSETGNELTYDYGFYLTGDHEIFHCRNKEHGLNVFYQAGLCPRNDNFAYLGAGCSYTGLLSKKGRDILGLAMARGLLIAERGKDETALELTYKVNFTDQIYLQPDFQYIIHPGGTDDQLKNASAAFLRLGLEF
jgi:porin